MTHTTPPSSVQHLVLGWFSVVLGLSGLSLAWHRAVPLLGDVALRVSTGVGALAALALVVLLLATLWRCLRWPQAVRDDLSHPVRHVFVAAVPTSFVLVATVMVTLQGPSPLADALWMFGSASLLAVTVWVAQRWLQVGRAPGAFWPGMTPALFIPVVGNVLPPLAGVALGHESWSAMQFGVAVLLWPVALTLVLVRIGMVGLWPERLLPVTFITIAPPALVGLSGSVLGAPDVVVLMAWGVALFFTLWSMTLVRRILAQPFGVAFWGLSFPLSGFAALSLRLVPTTPGLGGLPMLALIWLGVVTAVIAGLLAATVAGLLWGRLLVLEIAPSP